MTLSILGGLCGSLIGLGVIERVLHKRRLRSFKFRIHVNGTRGKSSVTRLIAAGLRAGNLMTCAKTTGTLPSLIHPNGSEEPIFRVGPPNVIEQLGVLRRCHRLGAEVVVIECMALQPFLQWISSARLIEPTHHIITNIREDHLEVMGPDVEGVARALSGSVAAGAPTYTSEKKRLSALKKATSDRGSELIVVDEKEADAGVSDAELKRFRYVEHPENVALALRVCRDLGVERDLALRGMQASRPDPGALTIEKMRVDRTPFLFINGFAANDPESTAQVWELSRTVAPQGGRLIALFNCRMDRPERSAQLGEAAAYWSRADYYVVCGTGTHFFLEAAQTAGLDSSTIQVAENESAEVLAHRLAKIAGRNGTVVGMANIGGVGMELIDQLHDITELEDSGRDT